MTAGWVAAVVVLWVVPIFVASSQGKAKGRQGAAYGILLGWVGVLVLAVLPARRDPTRYRECPFCREEIRADASVCPRCQRDVEPTAARRASLG